MTRYMLVTLVVCLLVALPLVASPKLPPDLQKEVNVAIPKGVEWLKKKQHEDGYWDEGKNPTYGKGELDVEMARFGVSAIAVLALLESDVPTTDPCIQKGMEWLGNHLSMKNRPSAYFTATFLMAIHSYARHEFLEEISKLPPAKQAKLRENPPPLRLKREHQSSAKVALEHIKSQQMEDGSWRYSPDHGKDFPDGERGDISSTQFALLGMHAADEMGFEVPFTHYLKACKWVLDQQEKDGPEVERAEEQTQEHDSNYYVPSAKDRARGWAYIKDATKSDEARTSGGMTTVGVCSLIVAKAHLLKHPDYKKNKETYNQAIFDGIAWLSKNWTVTSNPFGSRSYYYYLYGIERVGVLGGFDYISGHNWYKEGAETLVGAQKDEGNWIDNSEIEPRAILGTCFALLFLKRGTVPITSGQPER